MFWLGNFVFFDWLGWKNPNTCLLSYFNSQGAGENRNLYFYLLPLRFWEHMEFSFESFGTNNKRLAVGCALFSFGIDFHAPDDAKVKTAWRLK